MAGVFATLVDLCRFRRGPQDLPYSPPLLVALLAACALLQAWFNFHNGAKPAVVAAVLVGAAAAVAMVYVLLRARGKPERFVQTMTALAAVYLAFGVVADLLVYRLPLRELSLHIVEHPEQPPQLSGAQSLLIFAFAGLGLWQFCVSVGILRHALEAPTAVAVLMLFSVFFADWFVASIAAAMLGVA